MPPHFSFLHKWTKVFFHMLLFNLEFPLKLFFILFLKPANIVLSEALMRNTLLVNSPETQLYTHKCTGTVVLTRLIPVHSKVHSFTITSMFRLSLTLPT